MGVLDEVWIYRPWEEVWNGFSAPPSKFWPRGRLLHAAVSLANISGANALMVMTGGLLDSANYPAVRPDGSANTMPSLDETWTFDPELGLWELLSPSTPLPPRAGHTASVYSNTMYVFGGCSAWYPGISGTPATCASLNDHTIWMFRVVDMNWYPLDIWDGKPPPLANMARFMHSATVVGDVLYVLGGTLANYVNTRTGFSVNLATNSSQVLPDGPEYFPRGGMVDGRGVNSPYDVIFVGYEKLSTGRLILLQPFSP